MSAQLIVLGTRNPGSDADYQAYIAVAGPLFVGAGGAFTGQYSRTAQVVGDDGPQQVLVMEFPDEEAIQGVFQSPEYASVVPHRDAAFEHINVIIASARA